MTKRWPVLAVVLASCAWTAAAGNPGFTKPYFAATRPGSFALQRVTDEKGVVTENTYSRLADLAGERVFESRYEVMSGQYKGATSVTACLVPAAFSVDDDAIDYMGHARRCVAGDATSHFEFPADSMKAVAEGRTNYAAVVTFKGTETIGGRPTDHYVYQRKTDHMNAPATLSGELWLSPAVPFGLVKESVVIRDAAGKTVATFDTVLVKTGEGARTGLPKWSWSKTAK